MTVAAKAAVDMAYRAHGDNATYRARGDNTAAVIRVIDNIADHVIGIADGGDRPGAVALKPTVNIREETFAGIEPDGGILVLKGVVWKIESSMRINEFERQLTLTEQ